MRAAAGYAIPFASVRPGSGTARILGMLYDGMDGWNLRPRPGMACGSAARCLRRAVSGGLLERGPPVSLTRRGRWCCVAIRLGLSMPELAAVSSVYVQLRTWERSDHLRGAAAARFAIRDHSVFAGTGYRRSAVRDIYNRLVAKGVIYRVANGGLVGAAPGVMRVLARYGEDLEELCGLLRGGFACPPVRSGRGRAA